MYIPHLTLVFKRPVADQRLFPITVTLFLSQFLGVFPDQTFELIWCVRLQQPLSEVQITKYGGKRPRCLHGVLRAFLWNDRKK